MNPFGQELRKILTQCKTSGVVSYAGRSAYIQFDPDLRARLEFVSLNIASQYNALKLTILNRTEGAVDVNILRFGDLLGKKKVSNPNFSDGILPHLWDDYGKVAVCSGSTVLMSTSDMAAHYAPESWPLTMKM